MKTAQPSPSAQATAESPVTWHVIVWILLTLAISSMTQPSGRLLGRNIPRKSRLYFCLSPVLCVADAVSIVTSVLLVWRMFNTRFSNAVRFVVVWRRGGADDIEEVDVDDSPAAWPRWILFVVGTLPAFVKLVSFSGLPWSQVWGIMFASSYVVIEGLNLFETGLSSSTSTAEALGYTNEEWNCDENRGSQHKVNGVNITLEWAGWVLWGIAVLGQIALSVWILDDLREILVEREVGVSRDTRNKLSWVSGMSMMCYVSLTIGWFLVPLVNELAQRPLLPAWLFTKTEWLYFLSTWTSILPLTIAPPAVRDVDGDGQGSSGAADTYQTHIFPEMSPMGNRLFTFWGLAYCSWLALHLLRRCVIRLCEMFPHVASVLQVTKNVRVVDDDDSNLSWTEERVDRYSVSALIFFSTHLPLAIWWYAVRYDPAGTFHPAWNDIFG